METNCNRCHRCGRPVRNKSIDANDGGLLLTLRGFADPPARQAPSADTSWVEECTRCGHWQRPRSHGWAGSDVTPCLGAYEARSRGVRYINVTGHPLDLAWPDNRRFRIDPSGIVLRATSVDEAVEEPRFTEPGQGLTSRTNTYEWRAGHVAIVRVDYRPASELEVRWLEALERDYPGAVIIGSVFAAEAFPGRVVSGIAIKEGERVIRADRFQVF